MYTRGIAPGGGRRGGAAPGAAPNGGAVTSLRRAGLSGGGYVRVGHAHRSVSRFLKGPWRVWAHLPQSHRVGIPTPLLGSHGSPHHEIPPAPQQTILTLIKRHGPQCLIFFPPPPPIGRPQKPDFYPAKAQVGLQLLYGLLLKTRNPLRGQSCLLYSP